MDLFRFRESTIRIQLLQSFYFSTVSQRTSQAFVSMDAKGGLYKDSFTTFSQLI